MLAFTLMKSVALFVISVALAGSALAQQRDLSGTWVLDEQRSGSSGQEAFVSPVVWTVNHTADQIVVDRQRGDKTASFIYKLSSKPPARPADTTVVSPAGDAPGHRAYLDGERLVLETLQTIQGKTVTTREVLTLEPGGKELVVERVLEVEHGYTMKGAQNFSAVKDVFVRK